MNDAILEELKQRLSRLDVGRLRGRLADLAGPGRALWLPEQEPAAAEETLRRRAEELARPVDAESLDPGEEGREVVEFRLGEEHFGLTSSCVVAAARAEDVTAIPCAPAMVVGCLSLRGRIHSVLDARTLLGRPAQAGRPSAGPVIILQGPDMDFGLLVDEIIGVLRLPGQAAVVPAEPAGPYVIGAVCLGEGGRERLLTLLDGQALLDDETLVCREEVGE